ncbi:MAG: ABC transporter permease [Aureliella sp.]
MNRATKKESRLTQRVWDLLAIAGTFVAFLIAWHLAVRWFDLPKILLPTPWEVAQAAWLEREPLLRGFLSTAAAATLGLAASSIVGFIVALCFSQSRYLRAAMYPYVVFLQTVPIVAIAPLLIIWSGYRFHTVVLVSAIISFFPVVSNVTAGLLSVQRDQLDLFRLYGATRLQTLIKLRIPAAIHEFVLGVRISVGLAVIGAVVGDFFVGFGLADYAGLGSIMLLWQNRSRTDALIAAIIASTLLGVLLLLVINTFATFLLRRYLRRS